jgi:glutamate synthase (ferredoxin)
MPHEFLAEKAGQPQDQLAATGWLRRRHALSADAPGGSGPLRTVDRGRHQPGGTAAPRLAHRADGQQRAGPHRRATEPKIRQLFISAAMRSPTTWRSPQTYVIRSRIEASVRASNIGQPRHVLHSEPVAPYDRLQGHAQRHAGARLLSRPATRSWPPPWRWSTALQHQHVPQLGPRIRIVISSHNGEINTLRGNIGWMHARESMFRSELFGNDIKKVLPIIDESGSDSAMFDNALELLVLAGRSLPHAMMMMIPEPWGTDPHMSPEKKAFYDFHACLMEPWTDPRRSPSRM